MLVASITAAAAIISVAFVVAFYFFLQWIAQENILFTTVKEGTVKTIMRGDSFERFVMAFESYHLNDPSKPWFQDDFPLWDVVYHGPGNPYGFQEEGLTDAFYDDRPLLLKQLGLYYVGLPWKNKVYVYAFEWNEPIGKSDIVHRSESTDFIFVADFTYAIQTSAAETKDRLPVDLLTLVTVAIRNPYRALFSGEDWMQRITAAINRHARNFVGLKEYQELISAEDETEYSKPIIELTERLPDDIPDRPPHGLKGRYGAEVRTADLQTVELAGAGKEEYQNATTRVYIAKQDAEAIKTKGQAEADVITLKGEAEAQALQTRLTTIKDHGETGIRLAQLDAMRDAAANGKTVIWANNPFAP